MQGMLSQKTKKEIQGRIRGRMDENVYRIKKQYTKINSNEME